MSDESKVERVAEQDEPADEVEGHHKRVAANEEPAQEGDDEVEAHGRRMGAPETDNRTA